MESGIPQYAISPNYPSNIFDMGGSRVFNLLTPSKVPFWGIHIFKYKHFLASRCQF